MWLPTYLIGTLILCTQFVVNDGQYINYITKDTTYYRRNSPILIKKDTIVKTGVTLDIEPGSELRFSPGVMLGINGTLKALVSVLFIKFVCLYYILQFC